MYSRKIRRRIENFLYALFLIFTTIQNLRRIPWVDEYQAFNIATKSETYADLILAASADLHPPLWHIFIRLFSYLWNDYNVIKILLFLITVLTVIAIRKIAFIPFYIKGCLLLSSYFTFTYTSVSRDYSLVICFSFWIVYFQKNKSSSNIKYVLIGLLGIVNIFGLFLSVYFLLLSSDKLRVSSAKSYVIYTLIILSQFLASLELNPWNKDGIEISPRRFDLSNSLVSYCEILFQSIFLKSPGSYFVFVFSFMLVLAVVILIYLFSDKRILEIFSWLFLTSCLVLFADTGFPYGTHEWNRGMYFFSILIPLIIVYPTNSDVSLVVKLKTLKTNPRSSHILISIILVVLLTPTMTNTYEIYRNSKLSLNSFTFYHDPMREFVDSLDCFDETGRIHLISDTYGDWVTTQMNAYLPKTRKVQFFLSKDDLHWIRWTKQRSDANILLQKSEGTLVKIFLEEQNECLIIQDLLYKRNLKQFANYAISGSTPVIYGFLKPNRFLLLRTLN